jgi:hypothetical protein
MPWAMAYSWENHKMINRRWAFFQTSAKFQILLSTLTKRWQCGKRDQPKEQTTQNKFNFIIIPADSDHFEES